MDYAVTLREFKSVELQRQVEKQEISGLPLARIGSKEEISRRGFVQRYKYISICVYTYGLLQESWI